MKTQYTNLQNVEEKIEEQYGTEDIDGDYFNVDEDRIWYDLQRIDIPEFELSARLGTYCVFEEDGYTPDFSLTQLYDSSDIRPSKYQYFENDGLYTSQHNYLRAIDSDKEESPNTPCIIHIENYEEIEEHEQIV